MKHYIFFIFFLFLLVKGFAQDHKPCLCDSAYSRFFEPKLSGEVYYPMPGILGKESFIESYLPGSIELEDGSIVSGKSLKYNGRIDGLLLLPPLSSNEILLDKYFIKGFCFTNEKEYCFKKIMVKKEGYSDSTEIFAQVLTVSNLSLYCYRRYVHKEDELFYIDNKMVSRPKYEESPVYYFVLPNNKSIGFKSFRKRHLYRIFPDNKELMKKLFRENHQHRFRQEEDLIKITTILSSMF